MTETRRESRATPDHSEPAAVAWRSLAAVAATVAVVLLGFASRYGYHRDELYFLRAGEHLAFGYADQPPLTPLLARLASTVFGDSLVGLRVVPAVVAGLVVLVTGVLAAEFGAGRGAQVLAAGATAASAVLLAVGHLLSTSTVDLLVWTVLSWLVVRALRRGGWRWLLVGLVAGIGLQNKTLVAFLLVALGVGLLLVGPREVLRTRWFWLAVGLALVLWAPYLVWQASHGWPQLELARAIAAGGSGTSAPAWLFVPYQFVLVSVFLVPVWAVGLWQLATAPRLRRFRVFAVAYVVLVVVFLITGGKPYYLAGLYPVLLAAGSGPVLHRARAGPGRGRAALPWVAVGLAAVTSAVLFLPVVPVRYLAATPIVDINYDAGETVGWPAFVRTVARVHADLPADERAGAIVLTRNYGEAGAVDRYRAELGLPPVYSGHNGYWYWGPPPEETGTTIVVGHRPETLSRWFGSVRLAARIDNGVGVANEEQGAPVWVCRERRATWTQLWPQLRYLG